jgi:hypothetical protein
MMLGGYTMSDSSKTKTLIKQITKLKGNKVRVIYRGFIYYQSYCWDDGCEQEAGYVITERPLTGDDWERDKDCEVCDNHKQVMSWDWSSAYPYKQTFETCDITDEDVGRIELALGHSVVDGEYVDVKIILSANTADSILLNSDTR